MLKFQSKWIVQSAVSADVTFTLSPLGPRPQAVIAYETSKLQAELRDISRQAAALQSKHPALIESESGGLVWAKLAELPPDDVADFSALLDEAFVVRQQIRQAFVAKSLKEITGVELDGRPATVAEFLEYATAKPADNLFREISARVDELLETGCIRQPEPEKAGTEPEQETR